MKLRLMTTTPTSSPTMIMGRTLSPPVGSSNSNGVVVPKKVALQAQRFAMKADANKFRIFLQQLHDLQETVRAFDETSIKKAALYGKVRTEYVLV